MSDTTAPPSDAPASRNVSIQLANGSTISADVQGWDALSADEQTQAIHAIAQAHADTGALGNGAPTAAQPPADISYTGAFGYGVHNAAEGFGRTAELLGHATGWTGLENAGKGLEGATAAPANYQPTDLAGALRSGNYRGALVQLPRAAVEGGADLAGYLGAGAVAGPLGMVGMATARGLGDNVSARAANSGDAEPTAGDWLAGGATTAVQAGLAAVGLGRGPTAGLLARAPALARPVVAAGLDAAAAGASSAVGQVGDTVGTDAGAQLDPYQTAAAGLQAGAGRIVSTAPELAAVGIRSGTDAAMSALQPQPVSLDDAASISRVYSAYQAAAAAAKSTRGDVSPLAVMNGLKADLISSATETAGALRDSGQIDPQQARALTTLFRDQAGRSNSTIQQGGDGYATLFDRIDALPINDADATTLQNAARDLNTLSTQSFANRAVGPFQAIGRGVAQAAAIGGAIYSGSPAAMAMAALGLKSVSPVGSAVGAGLDRVLGTATPTVLLRARAANTMLNKAGVDAGPGSVSGLQGMTAAANAMPPPPGPSVADLAQARLDASAKANAVKLAIASAGRMPTPHPEIDDTAADAAVNNALKQADAVVRQAGNAPAARGQGSTPPPALTAPSPAPAPTSLEALGLPSPQTTLNGPQTALTTSPLQSPAPGPAMTPSESVASPSAGATAPVLGTAPPLPMTAPAGHPAAPGWTRFLANGRPDVSLQDAHDAVDATYRPEQAAVIKAHNGGIDAKWLLPVQQQLALMRPGGNVSIGLPASPGGGSPLAAGNGAAAAGQLAQVGIRNPLAYQGSIANNRAAVMGQVAAAHAAGVPEAVPMLHAVMAAHGTTPAETRQAKIEAAAGALKAIGDARRRAAALAYLTRPILAHGGPKGLGR